MELPTQEIIMKRLHKHLLGMTGTTEPTLKQAEKPYDFGASSHIILLFLSDLR